MGINFPLSPFRKPDKTCEATVFIRWEIGRKAGGLASLDFKA